MEVINWIKDNWLQIVQVYLSLIGTASIIVKLTPTTKDDEVLAKIKSFVGKFVALND